MDPCQLGQHLMDPLQLELVLLDPLFLVHPVHLVPLVQLDPLVLVQLDPLFLVLLVLQVPLFLVLQLLDLLMEASLNHQDRDDKLKSDKVLIRRIGFHIQINLFNNITYCRCFLPRKQFRWVVCWFSTLFYSSSC